MSRLKNLGNLLKEIVSTPKGAHKAEDAVKSTEDAVSAAAKVDPAKAQAMASVTEKLSDLTPGRFGREQLDARLKALHETAKNNNLLDATLERKEFSVKQIEQSLLHGEPVTPKELAKLQDAKQKDFFAFEKKLTDDAVRNKLRAEGKETFVQSVTKGPAKIGVAIAALVGIGLGADEAVLDGQLRAAGGNVVSSMKTNTSVSLQKAKQEEFAQLQRTCLAQGGQAGEISNSCIIPQFSDNFSSLSEVFGAVGAKESERVYVMKVADKLQLALDKSGGNVNNFNKLAGDYRLQVVKEMQADPLYRENLPDFEKVDYKIQRALQDDGGLALKLR